MATDETDVQGVIERMTAAFQAHEIETVMTTYEPGAAIAFEPGRPITDEEQIRQMFGAMASANPVFTYAGHEVVVSGDIALHVAPWRMKARTPDGEMTQSGLSVAVLRRQADGAWKMVIDNPHGSRLMP